VKNGEAASTTDIGAGEAIGEKKDGKEQRERVVGLVRVELYVPKHYASSTLDFAFGLPNP
jgi:hypothetical protein